MYDENTEAKIVELIEAAAVFAGDNCFTLEHRETTPLDVRKVAVLGIAISKWTQWDGSTIVQVAAEALEDANFHDIAGFFFGLVEAMNAPAVDIDAVCTAMKDATTQVKIAAS